jgi:hypothetical protein
MGEKQMNRYLYCVCGLQSVQGNNTSIVKVKSRR